MDTEDPPPPHPAPDQAPDQTLPGQPPAIPSGRPRTAPPLTKLNRPHRPFSRPGEEDGGPSGPEPTRYNDWERKGRACDF